VLCTPLGFVAIEAGWVVTEVGRQPWIVQGVLYTRDAVTPVRDLVVPLIAFTLLYLLLAAVTWRLLRKHVFATLPAPAAGGSDA
jgi:cytochrome d ubiquinol oxidase subunit I